MERIGSSHGQLFSVLVFLWVFGLALSCQACNQSKKDGVTLYGKANEFPLLDEDQRSWTPECTTDEAPLFLDPCVESDTRLLTHLLDGTVAPSHLSGTVEYQRADYTRKVFGLNAFGVPEYKRKLWGPLNALIDGLGDNPVVIENLQKYIADDAEYSCYFKAALRTHRDKDWIEALL